MSSTWETVLQAIAAVLLAVAGGGGVLGWQRLRNGRARPTSRPSEPPRQLDDRRAAARAAGFAPGDTGRFEALHSLGPMRCDGHETLVRAAEGAHAAATRASEGLERIEELLREQGEEMRGGLRRLEDRLASLGEWKGGVEARLSAVERATSRRGG